MKLVIVAAVAQNGVIGSRNDLPWYLPEDLKHFKKVTDGKTVLMGKNTYDSIFNRLGKPLPNRISVVLTRNTDFNPDFENVKVYHDLDDALADLRDVPEVMVAGGAQVFAQTMERADKLILTEVHKDVPGDTFFPSVDKNIWKESAREDHNGFSFVEYERALGTNFSDRKNSQLTET